jgi:uncharacterized 2Fe-2S/4Fe-4S cluster protein (DUF4445 family)
MINKISITVIKGNSRWQLETVPGKNLLSLCKENNIFIDAVCNGMGRCGKCVVITEKDMFPVTTADLTYISKKDLDMGYRLACRVMLKESCTIQIPDNMEQITSDSEIRQDDIHDTEASTYGVAIDIGTTTIGAALIDIQDSKVVGQKSLLNHQRVYGADVISRIAASLETEDGTDAINESNLIKMRRSILTDIADTINDLMAGRKGYVSQIVIAGNTTMLHLLRGYNCEGLGSYPYTPVTLDAESLTLNDLYDAEDSKAFIDSYKTLAGNNNSCRQDTAVFIMPGISVFVGADIVSGMYSLGFGDDKSTSNIFMLDMGTNGEMAFKSGDHIYVASTAAGPVFEGGGISCGTGSIPGAVSHIFINRDEKGSISTQIETINGLTPTGICGTGVLELVSELVRNGIIDKTGLLSDEFFDTGYVFASNRSQTFAMTQSDIRQVQLAKAAIRSGIEILISESAGVLADNIDKVYIAGGFGREVRPDAIRALQMLPQDIDSDKIYSPGNTSLSGCIKFIMNTAVNGIATEINKVKKIAGMSTEVILAGLDEFDDTYYEYLDF